MTFRPRFCMARKKRPLDSVPPGTDGARLCAWHVPTGNAFQVTSSGGRYSVSGMPDGEYIVSIEQAGLGLLFGAVRLAGDGQHVDFVLETAENGVVKAAPPHREPVHGTKKLPAKKTLILECRCPFPWRWAAQSSRNSDRRDRRRGPASALNPTAGML